MFSQCHNTGEDSGTPGFPRPRGLSRRLSLSAHSSALHHAMQTTRHASLSEELYVNVTVILNICCYDSVNECHKSVAVSGMLSVCGV